MFSKKTLVWSNYPNFKPEEFFFKGLTLKVPINQRLKYDESHVVQN